MSSDKLEGLSKDAVMKTLFHELTKEYIELDAEGRPFKIYQAPTDALEGTPCVCVQYVYKNITSTVVIKTKETYQTWQAAWDI